jgi:hypothetical protein
MPNSECEETANVLKTLSGGPELLVWFGGEPNFGDAELVSLWLDRTATSYLCIARQSAPGTNGTPKEAIIKFHLTDMIDVVIEGFSHQNVIGGLMLRRAPSKESDLSLHGIGLVYPQHEITLEPCAGAFGTIRASIINISIEPVR